MITLDRFWYILGMINFGIDILILFLLVFENSIEMPDLLFTFGRAHPLILHFPIVLIVLLPILPSLLASLSLESKLVLSFIQRYLIIAHFLCANTVLFGLILFKEGGYSGGTIAYHKWIGVILLFTVIILDHSWKTISLRQYRFRLILFIPMVLIIVTGHIGAEITHGPDFLTEPILRKETERISLEHSEVYRDFIQPIVKQKCLSCHNPSKSKGDLVLTDSISIMNGGESGEAIIIGDASESLIVQRLLLDIDHDEHMPPKGKSQLSLTEIQLIQEWINNGKLFSINYKELDSHDTLALLLKDYHESDIINEPFSDMKAAKEDDIASLNDDYRLLTPIARNSPALYARFLSTSHFKLEHLSALTKVQSQLVDLFVGQMPIDDEDLLIIKEFGSLQILNLNNTKITDEGLTNLHHLDNLQKIYLIGTKVSEEGIRNLLKNNPIKNVYLWDTGINSDGIENLRSMFPGIRIVGESIFDE